MNFYSLIALKKVYNDEEIKEYFRCIFELINKEELKLILEIDYKVLMILISEMYLLTQDNLYYEILKNYNEGLYYNTFELADNKED